MRYRHTAGWLAVATFVLMVLPGIGVMIAAPSVGAHAAGPAKELAPWALFALGLGMTLFGTTVTFGRFERVLDREARQVVARWSILGFGRRTVFPLEQFHAVRVASGTVSSARGARYTRYRVSLVGAGRSLYLTEFADLAAAGSEAARVARFLGLPMADDSL